MRVGPRVSVVIPVYNGGDFLHEAIDSVLAQTWPNVELIVVDDGSTDGGSTTRTARAYGNRIKFIAKEHGGVSSALNAGIREMTGDYFAWLSHDDIYLPEKLERQMESLARHGAGTISYTDYELVGPDLERIRTKIMPNVPPAGFRLWLMSDSALHGGTIVVPRSCFVGESFDERLATTQDYDMWFRLARNHRFVRVPEVLLKYRIHERQASWTDARRFEEGNRLLTGFLDDIQLPEIGAATKQSPSIVYLGAAVRFKLRGYREAASKARRLSAQTVRPKERLSVRRIARLAAYEVADPRLRPMYWWKWLHFRAMPARKTAAVSARSRTLDTTRDAVDS